MIRTCVGPGEANTGADENHMSSWAAGPTQGSAGAGQFVAALRRRRAAAVRCPALENGHADPLHDRPVDEPTAREVDSWRAAWAHLAALGYRVDVPAAVAAAGRAPTCGAAR